MHVTINYLIDRRNECQNILINALKLCLAHSLFAVCLPVDSRTYIVSLTNTAIYICFCFVAKQPFTVKCMNIFGIYLSCHCEALERETVYTMLEV